MKTVFSCIIGIIFLNACSKNTNMIRKYLFESEWARLYSFDGGFYGAGFNRKRKESDGTWHIRSHIKYKIDIRKGNHLDITYLLYSNDNNTDTLIYKIPLNNIDSAYYTSIIHKHIKGRDFRIEKKNFKLKFIRSKIKIYKRKNYPIYLFESGEGDDFLIHYFMPDLGVIKVTSANWNESFEFSIASMDSIIKEFLDFIANNPHLQ